MEGPEDLVGKRGVLGVGEVRVGGGAVEVGGGAARDTEKGGGEGKQHEDQADSRAADDPGRQSAAVTLADSPLEGQVAEAHLGHGDEGEHVGDLCEKDGREAGVVADVEQTSGGQELFAVQANFDTDKGDDLGCNVSSCRQ